MWNFTAVMVCCLEDICENMTNYGNQTKFTQYGMANAVEKNTASIQTVWQISLKFDILISGVIILWAKHDFCVVCLSRKDT